MQMTNQKTKGEEQSDSLVCIKALLGVSPSKRNSQRRATIQEPRNLLLTANVKKSGSNNFV